MNTKQTLKYFLSMTLVAFLAPTVVCMVPFVILGCFTPGAIVCIPILVGEFFLTNWLIETVLPRFRASIEDGTITASPFVAVLPFFVPLFYALVMTAIAFSPLFETVEDRVWLSVYAFAYTIPFLFAGSLVSAIASWGTDYVLWIPTLLAAFTSLIGVGYLRHYSSPLVGRRIFRAAMSLWMVCLVAAVPSVLLHVAMRQQLLTYAPDTNIVGGERKREPWADETNLYSYHPFSRNNKLVVIKDATLAIEENHPRLHSPIALYPIAAAAVQAIYLGVNENEAQSLVKGGTSPQAFDSLISGGSDAIIALRPSDKQLQAAAAAGKTLTITPIGREAFVFFVNTRNPVSSLTAEQIRRIYSKEVTVWDEVGGTHNKIVPFQRPEGSGSQTAMQRFMGTTPLATPLKEEYQRLMGGIVNRVADYRNYPHAIGYSFRYYVTTMFANANIKLLTVDGVEPTEETIRNGDYPLVSELCFITAGSDNPHLDALRAWFLSPQGQQLVADVGYVSL
ncbi:MAG: PstS family phosphate ABC transporter substrate-binding protein [Thermoguttaceae bacterium]